MHDLALHIAGRNGIHLPGGGTLTVRRFLMLGLLFGSLGGLDAVHAIVVRMRSDLSQFSTFSRPTLSIVEKAVGLDDNIIYAILHESIYCEGKDRKSTRLNSSHWE